MNWLDSTKDWLSIFPDVWFISRCPHVLILWKVIEFVLVDDLLYKSRSPGTWPGRFGFFVLFWLLLFLSASLPPCGKKLCCVILLCSWSQQTIDWNLQIMTQTKLFLFTLWVFSIVSLQWTKWLWYQTSLFLPFSWTSSILSFISMLYTPERSVNDINIITFHWPCQWQSLLIQAHTKETRNRQNLGLGR